MRINARAVVVLPWLVLVALTARAGRVPRLLPVAGGVVTLVLAGVLTVVGVVVLGRLGREPVEARPFAAGSSDERGRAARRERRSARASAGVAAVVVPPDDAVSRHACARTRSSRAARSGIATRRPSVRPVRAAEPACSPRLFGPPLLARRRASWAVRSNSAATTSSRGCCARRATTDQTPDEYRVRQLGEALAFGVLGGVAVAVLLHTPVAALLGGGRRLRRSA